MQVARLPVILLFMFGNLSVEPVFVILTIVVAAISLLIQYLIIKNGVCAGMREHTLWLESRALRRGGSATPPPK
jgi:uncharacterized YccA/Bax inhibitor family protein